MTERLVPPSETLAANGVTLRRWRTDDGAALVSSVRASQEHLRPWMPWAAGYDRAAANEYLKRCQQYWESGEAFQYAIMAGAKRVRGSAGLMARVGPGTLEIGYWVDAGHTGHGVATRAAALLAAAGLAVWGIDQLEIHHSPANAASAAVARKLGFHQVGERAGSDREASVVWRLGAADLPDSPIPGILGQARY